MLPEDIELPQEQRIRRAEKLENRVEISMRDGC
jgi:hypothetical protein